jgi:hypothetical protein
LGWTPGALQGKTWHLCSVWQVSFPLGDVNCVPWPDNTHSDFVTLEMSFINLLRQDLVVAVHNAYSLVYFVNVSKHTSMYPTPLLPTRSGPNRSKAHNSPDCDGKWLLLSKVKLLVGCFTCWHVSPRNNFSYLPSYFLMKNVLSICAIHFVTCSMNKSNNFVLQTSR